jgi:CheY-like chemotaxis protein
MNVNEPSSGVHAKASAHAKPNGVLTTDIPQTEEALETTRQASLCVLVVDDTPDVLVTAGAFLRSAGYVVTTVADGDAALRVMASDARIGVLVTDFLMPGLSGVELIALAAQIRPDIRALVITGYPDADGLEGLSHQIAVLSKPFRRAELIAGVNFLFSQTEFDLPEQAMELFER